MTSKYHKKILGILKEANLPKHLSDELKKELESHFYEKEHELRFSGLKEDEIQKQINEDFGNDELVANHLSFVHKKTFYSFIKNLMKNENKPYIFETVFLFAIVFFLYQNTVWDMATQIQIDRMENVRAFTEGGFINLGLFLILNFILIIRLFRGRALSQKLAASFLFLITLGQIAYTYTLVTRNIIVPNHYDNISDQELIENPYAYDEATEFPWPEFYNEQEGYRLNLPASYLIYRQDGTSDLPKYFSFPDTALEPEIGQVVAFGPAFGDDKEMIDVKVYGADNSPDKKENESWTDYYLRTQLQDKKYQIEPVMAGEFFSDADLAIVPGVNHVHLSEPLKMRQDILIQEENNRLYTFLYDDQNIIHKQILGPGVTINIPEEKINWITFDEPNCPFTLQIPDYWEEGYIGQNGDHVDIDKCEGLAFNFSQGGGLNFRTQVIETQDLKSSFLSQGLKIKAMGDTQWQDLPAKRFLVQQQPSNEEVGFTVEFDDEAGIALELKPNEWLIFYHASMDKISERVLNSLKIKTPNETPQEN